VSTLFKKLPKFFPRIFQPPGTTYNTGEFIMKLTSSKLKQLIQESLTENWRDEVGPPPDIDAPGWHPNDTQEWERSARAAMIQDSPYQSRAGRAQQQRWAEKEEEAPKEDLFASLSKEEEELAEDMLGWWSKQIDETGRLSNITGKDGSAFRRLGTRLSLPPKERHAAPLGFRLTEEHLELTLEALRSWSHWSGTDDLVPETKALISKIEAILSGDVPEEEPEPEVEVPEDERIDPRFAHLEFDEALRRQQKGQNTMKLTKNTLKQLIKEEMENLGAGKAVPVEDLSWGNNERGEMRVNSAAGEDHWTKIRTPEAFEEWKTAVLAHGPGSTTFINKYGRWEPASGPWKEKSDAYRQGKAQTLARWGSAH
jgi:hypothetical protein